MSEPVPLASRVTPTRAKPENLWLNLLFNAVLPGVLLSWLSKPNRLGPVWGLVVSLAFPVAYSVWDLVTRRTWSPIAVVAFVSILLTGGFGLLKVRGFWFAVKEAVLPMVLGLAIPLTLRTRRPLVRMLLYNDQVLDTAKIERALQANQAIAGFEGLLKWASWMLASAMGVSAIANFGLALWLLRAPPGTDTFNAQLGQYQLWSWPVSFLPTAVMVIYAMVRLIKGLETLTGLTGDDLLHARRSVPKNGKTPEKST